MARTRMAAGGGRTVEVSADRVAAWLNRAAVSHGGLAEMRARESSIGVTMGDGTSVELAVPFGPLSRDAHVDGGTEPIEALLTHVAEVGDIGIICVRERAYSIGVARGGVVIDSSTDTRYVQSRTAAGGWSQQRYARRRGNQRRDSYRAAAETATRLLVDRATPLSALVLAGDRGAIDAVLSEPRLAEVNRLPRRTFSDIAEPRRAVLDDVARRSLAIDITIRDGESRSER